MKKKLDVIDAEQEQYMKGAERKCRRIKSGRIPFSPESSKWIRRAQVYRSALRFHANKRKGWITSTGDKLTKERYFKIIF